ncbi:vacuolar protein sorting-associated protein 52 [Entomortierella parvispora]|uniref:Vacuolar protein sorting-associated protein 52 n=1 Tax=Entomortierella parvispora TaxID=205924 RepID=A0A9P3H3E5_9FUNG|nr:vacuolar protein sorting-associated protein 52 [Entomortierella parvispora]
MDSPEPPLPLQAAASTVDNLNTPGGQSNTATVARRNSQKRQSLTGLKFLNELLDDQDQDLDQPGMQKESVRSPKSEPETSVSPFLQDDLAFEQVGDRISEFQEDEFVKQALAKGMDLREYAHHIESELDIVGQDHEDDYVHQSQAFVDLHGQIKSCDEILETMENLLSIFQTDLGNISTEIQTLQTKSVTMSVQLKNRMAVENHLNDLLEGILVTPQLIRKIYDGEVDDTWLAALAELNSKMYHAKARQGRHIRALKEVGPELERLRIKAVEKIREFLLAKIKSFRIPNTNVQIMQHSVLLKYKDLNQFVMERHGEVAAEIRQTYANTLRWYFSNQFDNYATGLEKLQSVVGDKYDMLCTDENAKKGLFGASKALSQKTNVFAIGSRLETLKNQDAGLILIHVANEKNMKYPYEALFRSFNLALIDNASSEYLFLVEYFSRRSQPDLEGIQSVFTQIFEPTLKLGLANVKEYADSSFDAIGILLCLRINHQLAKELERRKIPGLDKYRDAIHMALWPRFQVVVDMHIDSVRKAKTKIKPKNVHPHWIARRYGEFAGSLLLLNDEQTDVMPRLALLRLETSSLFDVMSKTFPDTKSRLIFLINTFDLVLTLLADIRTNGVELENDHWKQALHQTIALFVEEELKPYVGDLISFIRMVEIAGGVSKVQLEHFERTSFNFSNTWRQSLLAINTSVIQHFSSFKNGTLVLHQVLGQLIVYYTRFHSLLDEKLQQLGASAGDESLSSTVKATSTRGWGHQPVGVQTVMVEVKKFRSNFMP